INSPVPAIGRFDHHRRRRARLAHHRRKRKRIIVHAMHREPLTRTREPHDHRASTMEVDPDILSIHRGLLLFARNGLWKPRVSYASSEPSRGAEAPPPSSHQIWRGRAGSSGDVEGLLSEAQETLRSRQVEEVLAV